MYRLAHATETTATVWARHTSNGTLTLTVNGQTFSGSTIDTSVADGTGTVTATGLSAGLAYPFSLAVGGTVIHEGTLRTMPAAGSSFSLLWAYCWHPYKVTMAIEQAMNKHDDIAAFFMGGDNIYSDADTSTTTVNLFGEAMKNVGAAMQADPANAELAVPALRTLYRSRFKEPGTKRALEAFPTYPLVSDHDMQTGDNWDVNHTTAAANAYITWATTQAEAEAVHEKHKQVFWEFYAGTPENSDANNENTRPDDEQFYFDFVIGDVHVFVLDSSNYKDRVGGDDYGTAQMAWLTSRLSASTSTWKIVATGEGITEYLSTVSTDHQAIIDHCVNNGINGVLFVAGDIHAPFYGEYGLPQVRGGQVSQRNHMAIPDGYLGGAKYKWLGYYSNGVSGDIAPHCVTVLRVTPQRLDVDYLDARGNVIWTKHMLPTDREMRSERPKIA